ncbi:MAG: hypothetical protein KIT09_07570 [Bryobacteraceae bacterium]|nr:hypothetical protein [Bryobacteraceae bacterium]
MLSLGGLGLLSKVADRLGCRPAPVNLFLFLWAGLLVLLVSLVYNGVAGTAAVPGTIAGVAIVFGILASVAVLAFLHAVHYGKISTSWLVINLSAALPTVLSVLLYREEVTLRRGASLLLVLVALALLWMDRRAEEARSKE